MGLKNSNNLPLYKRAEYRALDFLSSVALPWLCRRLPAEVSCDLKKPLSSVSDILKESLYGDKYKPKHLKPTSTNSDDNEV